MIGFIHDPRHLSQFEGLRLAFDHAVHHPRVRPSSIDAIPTTSETFLSFQIGNLRFHDSLQFLTTSLDTLVQSLAADGKDKFSHTARQHPDSDLVFAKRNYPYEYMNGRSTILLTELPPIDAFYSSLSEESITPEEYKRAQKVWREFCIENIIIIIIITRIFNVHNRH